MNYVSSQQLRNEGNKKKKIISKIVFHLSLIIYNLVNIFSNIVQVRRQSSKFNCHLFIRYWTYEIQPSSHDGDQDLQGSIFTGMNPCLYFSFKKGCTFEGEQV
jgi:hypothetical protein